MMNNAGSEQSDHSNSEDFPERSVVEYVDPDGNSIMLVETSFFDDGSIKERKIFKNGVLKSIETNKSDDEINKINAAAAEMNMKPEIVKELKSTSLIQDEKKKDSDSFKKKTTGENETKTKPGIAMNSTSNSQPQNDQKNVKVPTGKVPRPEIVYESDRPAETYITTLSTLNPQSLSDKKNGKTLTALGHRPEIVYDSDRPAETYITTFSRPNPQPQNDKNNGKTLIALGPRSETVYDSDRPTETFTTNIVEGQNENENLHNHIHDVDDNVAIVESDIFEQPSRDSVTRTMIISADAIQNVETVEAYLVDEKKIFWSKSIFKTKNGSIKKKCCLILAVVIVCCVTIPIVVLFTSKSSSKNESESSQTPSIAPTQTPSIAPTHPAFNVPVILPQSMGWWHSCALSNNTMYCWGYNKYYQLGIGDSCGEFRSTPIKVLFDPNGGTIVKKVAPGLFGSCAILDDGILKCWGSNLFDEIDWGYYDWFLPTTIDVGAGNFVTEIALGDRHKCVILDNGSLKCWGYNEYGQLGDGTNNSTNAPSDGTIDFGSGRSVTQITLGNLFSCAILDNGSLNCWGRNNYGQLGDGTKTNRNTPTPINFDNGRSVIQVALGREHACALLDNGVLYCWGSNQYGQLGDGTNDDRNSPTEIDVGIGRFVTKISVRLLHSCAMLDDGSLKCWGKNRHGQLGDGTNEHRNSPTQINVGSGRSVTDVSLGGRHSCVILDNGFMKCWGQNTYSQLGDGTKINKNNAASTEYILL